MIRAVLLCYVVLLLVFCCTDSVQAAATVFMNLDGIEGESQDADHTNWVECLSFSHFTDRASTQPTSFSRSFSVVKEIDKATPLIQERIAMGVPLETVVIDLKKPLTPEPYYYQITLSNATMLSSYVADAGTGSTETVTFEADFMQWLYLDLGDKSETTTYGSALDNRSGYVTSNIDGDLEIDMIDDDDDNDGSSDMQEFWAGTDATDPDDIFKIKLVQLSSTNGLLTWRSGVDRQFNIYRSFHPTGTYQQITFDPVPAAANGPTTSYEVPLGSGDPLFYIVSEWP